MTNDARENILMNSTVSDTVKQILQSVEDDNIKLKVKKLTVVEKFDNKDIKSQMDVRNKNQIWANDLRADLEVIDKKTGKIIDRAEGIKVTTIPKITDRGTYLINGNEYNFTKQSRLKPGVYTKRQTNGEISSFFNVDKTVDFDRGFNNNFKLNFDPETKIFTMGYGSKNVPLINALRVIGISQNDLVKKWGQQVYDANAAAYDKHELRDQNKLYEAVFGTTPPPGTSNDDVRKQIKDRLFATSLDPDTTTITLGKPYTNVNKDVILDASKKVIDIHKGEAESDDRESLVFKSFYDIEDHIRERLVKNSGKIISNIKYKLNKNKIINKSISSQSFDPFVVGTVTTSQLSTPPEQTNVMSMLGSASKMTVMGEGGIGTQNAITNDTRKISNSEAGFIDPLHTPEGGAIGVSVHSSIDTIKVGNDLYSKMIDRKGKNIFITPKGAWNKNIAFPDEFDITKATPTPKKSTIKVINQGKMKDVKASEVDAIIANPIGMFDTSVNMIPFLNSIQGNRGLTAAKMQEQALPLKNRERPLFNILDERGRDLGKNLASVIAIPKSEVDGTVVSVTDNEIVIKDKSGKKHVSQLYNNFSLNGEAFLHNEPIVKAGDPVKTGDVLADNNNTRQGSLALGANLKVAYIPYKGYNYEDSAIMSESAAKKLVSEHMYDFKDKRTSGGIFSRDKFKAYYPEALPADKAKKLDKDGVIKVGERVEMDDVIIAHLERKSPTSDDIALGRLDKQLKRDMSNNAMTWDKDVIGVVKSVTKSGNSVVVNVKTEEPLKVADKISGLHGNKHIISKIVPDEEMPYDAETGERIDLTMSPLGVSSRINTSQILEAEAGKIAKKTGKPYDIYNFSGEHNSLKVLEDLKKNGLSDKEILIDPETKKPILNPVATGIAHILKLEHVVDHKFSARYKEGYDVNEQAASGGKTGGKNLGRMEMAALLARGANENLREMFQIKGQKNEDYWRAMETGQSLPPPKKSFAWDKMLAMMNGAGINVEQKGKTFTLKPMTDKDILEMSSGEITRPDLSYRKKDLAPIKDGLFDPVKAGGLYGENFTHFKLPEPTLNPMMASATANLLNMPLTHLDSILTGGKFIDKTTHEIVKPGSKNAISGGPAVQALLERINVKNELKKAEEESKNTTNPTALNKLHRKIRYLRASQDGGFKPSDYIISNVLVTPSKFRPVFQIGTEGTVIVSDINDLYQQTAYTSSALKNLKTTLDESIDDDDVKNIQLAGPRGALYNDLKSVVGLGDPTAYLHRVKNKKGFISQIDGGDKKQTKEGFYQDKVLERRQDLVGRSTIILNPELGGDELGVPKEMAGKIFQPFIMKKMVEWGYKPAEAQKHIKDNTPIYQRAMQVVADERLVIANRAPTLHRWNMTAFKPKLTDGKSIEVPGVTVQGNFGGDFDGDTFQLHVPLSSKAIQEAESMKPSASMLKTGYDTVLNKPALDMIAGDWLVSKGKGGKDTKLSFSNIDSAREDFKNHKLTYGDTVTINGIKAPLGIHELNSILPEDVRRYDIELTSKNAEGWIRDVTKKHNGKLGLDLANKLKDIGNNYVTTYGLTLGLSDTIVDPKYKKQLIDDSLKGIDRKDSKLLVASTKQALSKGIKKIEEDFDENTMVGIGLKSGAGKGVSNFASIALMPGIVTDVDGDDVAVPITKGYAEGLNTSQYWAASHGARSGNIQRSVQSFKPGWLTKDLVNSIYETRIEQDAPVDSTGLEFNIDEKKHIINRYLAQDVKDSKGKILAKRNDIVDSDLINKLNSHRVKNIFVQSPITDPTPGDGFSSYSYGTDYNGKRHNIGDNIGIMSAHTITEPSLNLAMKAFHTGGASAAGKHGSVFDALDRLLRFTKNIPGKATLSSMDGVVKNVAKSPIGGWDVVLKNDDKEEVRYVDTENELFIKKGDKVHVGDKISSGITSVHDVLKYKGIKEAQKFLVKELDNMNDGKLDSRDIETVVRGISNTARVLHQGSSTYAPYDVAPLTTIEDYNRNNNKEEDVETATGDHLAQDYGTFKKHTKIDKNVIETLSKKGVKRLNVFKDRIKFEPFLAPAGISSKAQTSEDWIARLGHNRIAKVLEEGAAQGYKSTVDPLRGNPVIPFVTGEYGRGF